MEQPILSHMPRNREAGLSIRSLPLAVAVTPCAASLARESRGIRIAAVLPRKKAVNAVDRPN